MELDEELQAKRRCTLPVFRGKWSSGEEVSCHMGREPPWELVGMDERDVDKEEYPGFGTLWTDPRKAWESIKDGCGGGWYRCEFIGSIRQYRRDMTEGGGRVSNPYLDRTDDDRVLEAIVYYERCEAAARANYIKTLDSKRPK